MTATYSYTNAELLSVAQAPFAADAARVTAFDVSADGGTLVLAYAATGSATPTDAMALAVIRHTPRTWRFYAAGEEGNPSTANEACISDGRWALRYTFNSSETVISPGSGTQAEATSGNAYANAGGGEFLDLSGGFATNLTANTRAEINANLRYAFGTNETCRVPRVILHSPNVSSVDQFTKFWDGVEELVLDTAKLTWIGSWNGFPATMKRVVLNCPKVTTLAQFALNSNASGDQPCGETDATTDISFPALKTMGIYSFGKLDSAGILDLPSVVTVSSNALFYSPNLTEIRLSAEKKTLTTLANAFPIWKMTPHLARLTLGGVDGFTFAKGALNHQTALEVVTFTGGVPAFEEGTTQAFPDQSEKSIRFCVPRDHAGWAAALDGHVQELTADERKALWEADPDKPLPFGVVDKTVFLTTYPQYVCWIGDEATARLTVDHDDFFGDEVEVTSDWAPAADGSYLPGTTLTLTPKASETGTFVKWYGDVPGGASTATPLTLVLTKDAWVYARFTHPWTLSEDKTTAANGNFTVNCAVNDESARTLTLGKEEFAGLFADADEGEGVLDLGGAVTDGEGNSWTFSQWLNKDVALFVRIRNGKGNATALLSPGTIQGTWILGQPFHVTRGGNTTGVKSYRTVILDEPQMTGSWIGWNTCGQTDLTRFVFRTPRLEGFSGNCGFWQAPLSQTDFGWWDLSGVTSISPGAFLQNWGRGNAIKATGTLRLPSFRAVAAMVSSGSGGMYVLGSFPNAEGFVLGGATKRTTVTSLGDSALGYNSSLKTLEIHNAADLAVGATPFSGGATPTEITFTGKAIQDGGAAFANLLADVTAAETKPVVIYASENYGWGKVDYIDTSLTDAELAQVPAGERALGVYRGGAEAPAGKALVIHRASPYDPNGGLLIIR